METIEKKSLYDHLNNSGLLEFGMVFPKLLVQEFLGIEYEKYMTVDDYTKNSCDELSAVDTVRLRLLEQGMYLASDHGNYRILLPSQNAKQVETYLNSAKRKCKRANILAKNTPTPADGSNNINTHIIHARLASIKEQQDHNRRLN